MSGCSSHHEDMTAMNFPPNPQPCRGGCKCTYGLLFCNTKRTLLTFISKCVSLVGSSLVFLIVLFYIGFSEMKEGIFEIYESILRGSSEGNTKNRCGGGTGDVNDAVRKALEEYDADKTTRADFALESAGGTIVSVRDTEQYEPSSRSCTFFGLPICPSSNGPRQILQPSVLPGECWAFAGSTGTAIIKLLGRVRIDSVSLEHIPKSISPTGLIDTAPNEFVIMGLEDEEDDDGDLLGTFTYDINGPTLQTYQVFPVDQSYQFIEFGILSNHGNPDFTCVYRLRVHGTLETTDDDRDDL